MAEKKPNTAIAKAAKEFIRQIDEIDVPEGRVKDELMDDPVLRLIYLEDGLPNRGQGIALHALATFVAQNNYSEQNEEMINRITGKAPIYRTIEAVGEGNTFANEFLAAAVRLPREDIFSRLETATNNIAESYAGAARERTEDGDEPPRQDSENHLTDAGDSDKPKDRVVEASDQVAAEEDEAQKTPGKRGSQSWKNGPTEGPPVDDDYIKETAGDPDDQFEKSKFEKLEERGGVFQNKFANIDDPALKDKEAQQYLAIARQVAEIYDNTLGPELEKIERQRNEGGRSLAQ